MIQKNNQHVPYPFKIIERPDIQLTFPKGYNKPSNYKFKNAILKSNPSNFEFISPNGNMKFYLKRVLHYCTIDILLTRRFHHIWNSFPFLEHLLNSAWGGPQSSYFCNFVMSTYDHINKELFIVTHFPMTRDLSQQYHQSAFTDMVYEMILEPDSYGQMLKLVSSNYLLGDQKITDKDIKNIQFFITRDRTSIFEIIYNKYMGFIDNKFLDKNLLSFLDSITDTENLKDYIDKQKIEPINILISEGVIETPILEQIDDQWLFYKHNYIKHKDKLGDMIK